MKNSEKADRKTYRLSERLSVEITVGVSGMVCEWEPSIPGDGLTRQEMQSYRQARGEMLHRLAAMIGGRVLCIDL